MSETVPTRFSDGSLDLGLDCLKQEKEQWPFQRTEGPGEIWKGFESVILT